RRPRGWRLRRRVRGGQARAHRRDRGRPDRGLRTADDPGDDRAGTVAGPRLRGGARRLAAVVPGDPRRDEVGRFRRSTEVFDVVGLEWCGRGIVGARYRKSARAARPSEGCQDRTLNQNFAFLTVTTNSNSFFPVAEPARYEGPQARSPFAFRYYDKNRRVLG